MAAIYLANSLLLLLGQFIVCTHKMTHNVYLYCSGVSVNVQDLAPSCAGALFGKSEKAFTHSTLQQVSMMFSKCFMLVSESLPGVMNTCGAFSGEFENKRRL